MRVLLVEDDPMIGDAMHAALKDAAYAADWVRDGRTALDALVGQHYDLVLLDLGLPGKDGLEVLGAIRARADPVPLLIVTARDGLDDRLRGLDGGADDYLLKPFDLDELVARLHALLRRSAGRTMDRISHGGVTFEPSSGQAWLHGEPVELSRRERTLLATLLQHPRAILSAEQLRDRLYGLEQEVESNAVNVHIHHLRRKLGSGIVETVRGIGYRLGSA